MHMALTAFTETVTYRLQNRFYTFLLKEIKEQQPKRLNFDITVPLRGSNWLNTLENSLALLKQGQVQIGEKWFLGNF